MCVYVCMYMWSDNQRIFYMIRYGDNDYVSLKTYDIINQLQFDVELKLTAFSSVLLKTICEL